MATDGEGGNPHGGGFVGRAMGAIRGATAQTSRGAWNSGNLEFDTSGVKEFTTEIGKAEKQMAKFVGHFDRLANLLKGLDQKKLDALANVGAKAGGGSSYIDAAPLPTTGGGPARHDASTDNNQTTPSSDQPSAERGHNTNRFGGMAGGVAGAYFAGELIQRAGTRLSEAKTATRSTWAGYDYANTLNVMRQGGSYNSYAANSAWSGFYGAESQADAVAARTRVGMHWGAGNVAGQRGLVRDLSAMNAITGGAMGGASGAVQSWEGAFASPQAQWALIQQGIRPAIQGGQPRGQAGLFGDIILRAAGEQSFSDLSRSQAAATFGYGGQGRQNLSVIAPGMSPEMIDALALLASEAAGGRGVRSALKADSIRNTIIGKEFETVGETVEAGAEQSRRGRETQMKMIDAEGELVRATDRLKSEFANLTPVLQTFGDKIAGIFGAGATASALVGSNEGEGGGGFGGVLRTAFDIATFRRLGQIVRNGGGGTGGSGLLGRVGSLGRVLGPLGRVLGPLGLVASAVAPAKDLWDDPNTSIDIKGAWDNTFGRIGDAVGKPEKQAAHFGYEYGTHHGDGPLRGPGRTAGLNQSFMERLKAMFQANPRLSLTSGFRTKQEQTRLWNNRHKNPLPVARPGTSRHESGVAADIGPRSEYAWLRENAPKFGLSVPMPVKDPPHIEMGGAPTTSRQPEGEEPANESIGEGVAGGIFKALHKFAVGFSSSTSGLVESLSKAPGLEHGFSGGGGLAGSASGAGSAPTGSNGAGRADILSALRAAGFSGESLRMAYAIGMAESRGNTAAKGDISLQDDKWGPSIGFMQIRSLRAESGKGTARDATRLTDVAHNARAAWEISGGGTNWKPWTMYKNDGYKQFYDPGIGDAVRQGGGSGGSGGSVSVQSGGMVSIEKISLSVQIVQATEAEAERFARMAVAKIKEEAEMQSLGSV